MQKTIIVYSSVDGHTKEICQKIASQLEHQVDIVSVDDNPMIEDYERIIIGASICLLYTSPSPRDVVPSRMPSSA